MAALSVSQHQLAAQLRITRSSLNAYLNGYQTPPDGLDAFVKRALAALDRLEKAERAAERARQRVLGGAA